jgi:hypothetical protein
LTGGHQLQAFVLEKNGSNKRKRKTRNTLKRNREHRRNSQMWRKGKKPE